MKKSIFFFLAFIIIQSLSIIDCYAFSGLGSGTSADPYQITNVIQLQEMRQDPNINYAYYILMNNIDASETSTWNGGVGFAPIGFFYGVLDGQGHKITGLFIKGPYNVSARSYNYVGLFSGIASSAIIKNVGLEDVYVLGYGGAIGGLVGHNWGTISNSYVTGSVTGSYRVGGLVGESFGLITNSFATCSVTSHHAVGGLVGWNYNNGTINKGTITYCYSTGHVTGSYQVGGLVGEISGVTTNSYWDKETSGQSSSSEGTGKTSAQMKAQSTYTGWDFTTIWYICTNNYPKLRAFLEPPVSQDPSLIGYWKFDEGTGTTAADFSGNGNTGTLIGGPVWTTEGKVGGALSFGNSVNSVVTLPITAAMSQRSNFTISTWVKANSVSGDNFIYSQDLIGGATIGFLRISNGQAQFWIINDRGTWEWQSASGITTLSTGVWYHLVGVLNSSAGMTLYVNGVVDGSNANYLPLDITPGSVEIGAFYYQGGYNIDHFNGLIDEVAIYNRALSASEISALYSSSSNPTHPTALCKNINIYLDEKGSATIIPQDIDNGSSVSCGIATMTVSPSSFNCSNIGNNNVTLNVTNNIGISSTCNSSVTVLDNITPIVNTQNIIVQMDANGKATITPGQINNGSYDNCGISTYTLDINSFDCTKLGANTVYLTVTDVNGNSAVAPATVTVQDNLAPTAVTQNITVQLDETGNETITPSQINNGSFDNCGIATYALDVNSFDCTKLGANTVYLTVTDVNGNSAVATAMVTVQDNIPPTITVSLNPLTLWPANNQLRTIDATVDVSDNCLGTSYELTSITSNEEISGDIEDAEFGTADLTFDLRAKRNGKGSGRTYTVLYTATDASDNTAVASATVKVPHDERREDAGTGISDMTEYDNITIKPNPAIDYVDIVGNFREKTDVNIVFYNLLGEKISEIKLSDKTVLSERLVLDKFQSGIYFVEISYGADKIVKKIFKF